MHLQWFRAVRVAVMIVRCHMPNVWKGFLLAGRNGQRAGAK